MPKIFLGQRKKARAGNLPFALAGTIHSYPAVYEYFGEGCELVRL